jgi:hypothetical protein
LVNIALVGMARTGKNTVADMIRDYLELNGHGHTRLMSFGEELKTRFHDAFPEIPEIPKPRDGYEMFGKLGRHFDENIWVKALSLEMSGWKGLYQNFIITDLRQPNEERWAKENNFILIDVWSNLEDRRKRSQNDSNFTPINKSELKLHEIECSYRINNTDGLDYLQEQVETIMKEVLSNG